MSGVAFFYLVTLIYVRTSKDPLPPRVATTLLLASVAIGGIADLCASAIFGATDTQVTRNFVCLPIQPHDMGI